MLADEKLDFATTRLDASLEIRPAAKRPLRANSRLRLYIGTAETIGRAILLEDKTAIAPKERCLVQIVTDDPIVALGGDRFVIRDETNMRTLGGGVVLNPLGRRVRKPLERYRANLEILRDGAGADALEALIDLQESLALSALRAQQLLNAPQKEIAAALKDARFIKLSMGDEEGFTTAAKWDALGRFALAAVTAHHAAEPLALGLEMEALRSRLPWDVSARAFRSIVDRLGRETGIVRDDSVLRLASHQVHLGGAAGKLGGQIEQALAVGAISAARPDPACAGIKTPAGHARADAHDRGGARARRADSSRLRPISISHAARLMAPAQSWSNIWRRILKSLRRHIATCSAPRASSRSRCWTISIIAA